MNTRKNFQYKNFRYLLYICLLTINLAAEVSTDSLKIPDGAWERSISGQQGNNDSNDNDEDSGHCDHCDRSDRSDRQYRTFSKLDTSPPWAQSAIKPHAVLDVTCFDEHGKPYSSNDRNYRECLEGGQGASLLYNRGNSSFPHRHTTELFIGIVVE
ncbi:MAG: hypothetical protein HQK53_02490 [Oligoflexia bacterium]|nr:hypothetical protein [Oligoflexia bacterium]